MKRVFIFLIALLIIFTFSACDISKDGPHPTIHYYTIPEPEGTITVSYDTSKLSDEDKIDSFIEAYKKKYPKVTVKKDYSPGNIYEKLLSGEIGDVFYIENTELYDYSINVQATLPLNQFIEPLNFDISLVPKDVFNAGQVNNILYMMPFTYSRVAMMYNKTAVKEEGLDLPENNWTWEDFKHYCEKLTKKENDIYTQVGSFLNYSWEPVYMTFFEGWGEEWYIYENHSIDLRDASEGIYEVLSLAEKGVIKPEGKADLSSYKNLSDTDYVFRTVTYKDLEKYSKEYEDKGLEWDLVSFPETPVRTVGVEMDGLAVYRFTKNPTAATAFVLFLATPEGQDIIHKEPVISVPINTKVAEKDIWKFDKNKNMEAFTFNLEAKAAVDPAIRVPSDVAEYIKLFWQTAVPKYFEGTDYEEALMLAEEMANKKWETEATE